MSKLYIVCQRAYEYNDEYYTSSGGGDPLEIFNNHKDANDRRIELGRKFVREHDERSIKDYFVDWKSPELDEIILSLTKKTSKKNQWESDYDFSKLSDLQCDEMLNCFRDEPFYIKELPSIK